MVKRLLAVLLCVMPLFANAQSVKLGHLDVNSLFLKLPELKDVEAKLKEVQASYETEMKRMEEEYTRKASEYQQNVAAMDETIKKNREEELMTLQEKMKNYFQIAQNALQQKQEELQNPIREKILAAIKSVSEENGFTYIFDTNALLFKSASATDITDLVLKKLGVTK
ncbi:MAG: OmpH family outer membrane protein [Paludibacteraceae bacterium]|nr:OmpH family outer membrane protein [Paludibacteraceae bacterium]MDD5997347.1 OmpH family outer membrane protein [Bacteroidales bacterium]MBR6111275.1 OmpH family outer membrane protein [Paludibacteraceae bacterium]MBS7364474.1 OmpH family outer membrane protein [Paludibacteraceae bacterium]MEE0083926.1 OmpH family outer membrane protein [Paludibacteraceae bacterium]